MTSLFRGFQHVFTAPVEQLLIHNFSIHKVICSNMFITKLLRLCDMSYYYIFIIVEDLFVKKRDCWDFISLLRIGM